ncbi:hypothetical protein NW759_015358 [Fusarium solani]|nr:hypothetical protein NW759_015358 [Fusarium solani]
MGSIGNKSLLEALEGICNVDVDSVDPRVATALPFKAHNQTSNQVICANAMVLPEYQELLSEKVKQFGNQGWEEAFNRVVSGRERSQSVLSTISLILYPIDGPVLCRQYRQHHELRSRSDFSLASI